MSVDARKVGLSAAVIAGAFYTVCALLVALVPGALNSFFEFVMHVDLSGLSRPITWVSFILGVLIYSTIVGLHVWGAAALYNRLTRKAQL